MTRRMVAGLFALAVGFSAPAIGQERGELTLVDRRLTAGKAVGLIGAHFPAGSRLALALQGAGGRSPLGTFTAGPDGTFRDSVHVSGSLAPGAYRLEARTANDAVIAGLDVAILAATTTSAARRPNAVEPPAPMTHPGNAAPAEGGPAVSGSILGYDWPRLHAALNDFPAALLLVAVAFEIAGLVMRRPSLRAASFWTLLAGLAGTIAAVVAGLMAEDIVEHDDIAHAVMERHKTLALITLGVFAVLTVWRVARRRADHRREQAAWAVAGAGGVALLIATAQLGGSLTFDHGLGVPTATLRQILEQRGEETRMDMGSPGDSTTTDSAAAPGAAPHHDAPGTAPQTHTHSHH